MIFKADYEPHHQAPIRKHLITNFKFIDSTLLTNSNPQPIVALLCLYKGWHHPPGYELFVSLLSGIHQICIPAFPFNLPTQSGTDIITYTHTYTHAHTFHTYIITYMLTYTHAHTFICHISTHLYR